MYHNKNQLQHLIVVYSYLMTKYNLLSTRLQLPLTTSTQPTVRPLTAKPHMPLYNQPTHCCCKHSQTTDNKLTCTRLSSLHRQHSTAVQMSTALTVATLQLCMSTVTRRCQQSDLRTCQRQLTCNQTTSNARHRQTARSSTCRQTLRSVSQILLSLASRRQCQTALQSKCNCQKTTLDTQTTSQQQTHSCTKQTILQYSRRLLTLMLLYKMQKH